jgi:bifunctional enzyme CysN/CysC
MVDPAPAIVPGSERGSAPADGRPSELVRVATAGSVDDGKSTLIGRLLFDSKQIFEDQLEHVERTSLERGDGYTNLALLTDGLRAEREQGITIDVAYRYFHTPRRKFIVADTPGHEQYTRNMVTGASTADVAMILVDARNGVLEQSRRHTFLASLLRIPHLMVCVNKMDLVDFEEEAYDAVCDDLSSWAARLDVPDITFIPMSALHGDNVVERSERMPWYQGPSLVHHLEHVHVASDRNLIDCRFPVQWVTRPMSDEHHDYRGYAGQVAGGVFKRGDEVVVLPSGAHTRIAGIDTYDGELEEAFPPLSVTMRLEDQVDVSRGDMICRVNNHPVQARQLEAMVCWMSERPLEPSRRYRIKHTTRTALAKVDELRYRIDVNTLHRDESATGLELNEIGRLNLRLSAPLLVDEYRRNRSTGSFILIDETTNDTVGAGTIIEAREVKPGTHARTDIRWHPSALDRRHRWQATGQPGATIWFTGLPASGKSTVAVAVERALVESGRVAYLLDGDNLRHGLSDDLGFSPGDRTENIRRVGHLTRLLADAGVVALASLVSPLKSDRETARALNDAAKLTFIEVYVATALTECARRDPKGLYARALRGELTGLTGVDAPYEPPEDPDLVLDTTDADVDDLAAQVIALLNERSPRRQR